MKTLPQTCEQCLELYSKALEDLELYAQRAKKLNTTEANRELIINFEITHELALKVMAKFFEKIGKGPFSGSRDATVEAFHAELIDDGKAWLDIVIDRIKYNPVYEMDTQQDFVERIQKIYIPLLEKFEDNMSKKLDE
ncbi:nucleotidyltransferase substrate binding protein (TIGR01987 family) [Algoriphagus aquaeductus]|uniref:Nucleotidyltransferase substrate binding protein (TIGR01987 family) n=1 Tax=Algoriphagus aquaeductus TaxID=475299 RepID=A0A326RY63_9BACT|nr:nucleotidyltransferase substrate binding protein [Algoriphagus aquaeductus]PZV85368.1 nucleotidyltransferase substrate binding protein (TIGR01987 family) [Algoriphagus aquaeductus]